jgi:transposase
MTSEAAFAALAGTTPVDASSGKQHRHRLNRGGDRELNWALHVIALQRIHHPETATYHQRLLASGKTTREAAAGLNARPPATPTTDCARSPHPP